MLLLHLVGGDHFALINCRFSKIESQSFSSQHVVKSQQLQTGGARCSETGGSGR